MRQMVSNACGAVAIVHLVMNTLGRVSGPAAGSGETARDGGKTARDEGGEMARGGAAAVQGAGSEAPEMLRDFGRAMQGDSAHERGRRLAPALRQVHAELAGQGQTSAPRSSAVLAFHFISLVEVRVRVWCVHGMCMVCARTMQVPGAYQAHAMHMPCAYHAHASQVHGRLYELDGNNDGPLDCGGVGDGGFLTAAVRHGQGQ